MSNVPFNEAAPGRYAACLPRKSKVGAICPLVREHLEIIPQDQWEAINQSLNNGRGLRDYVPTILDQDGAGSCATESTTMSVMLTRKVRGMKHVLLNPWFIYYHTGGQSDMGNGRGGGSAIDDVLQFARQHGIASEAVWPRKHGWQQKPSGIAYEDAKQNHIEEFFDATNILEAASCLLRGWPLVYGAKGHSVLRIALHHDVNSWGNQWGDQGFGEWVKLHEIDFRYGAFAVRTTTEV